jgi:hypothetical protein
VGWPIIKPMVADFVVFVGAVFALSIFLICSCIYVIRAEGDGIGGALPVLSLRPAPPDQFIF